MIGTLRRCPASFQCRSIFIRPFSYSPLTASRSRPNSASTLARIPPAAFQIDPLARRHQSGAAAAEAQIEQDVNRQHPPSEADIDRATAMGPLKRFSELAEQRLVEKVLIDTITKRMGLSTMTQVQSMTIDKALEGIDVLAQAKTGTGKTIGFLLPLLQRILLEDPSLAHRQSKAQYGNRASDIRAIVVSPTRELAEQIATEARKLTSGTGIVIQTAVGGTQKRLHLSQMHRDGCHVLIGTPGRMKDIFSDPMARVSAPKLGAFVLDEADRLMDQGFWPEIQEIQALLPDVAQKDRQTLMFSATIPREVAQLAQSVMKPNGHYVRTVQQDETPTVDRVTQKLVTVPSLENVLPAILELCSREIAARASDTSLPPFKAIVYFGAVAEAHLAAEMFQNVTASPRFDSSGSRILPRNVPVLELHSRLTQSVRTRNADVFRRASSAILMSSDVTARGMDFPGVTHVIQAGLPTDRDAYIHRIGRTARAGQEGQGWLFLALPAMNEGRIRLGNLPLQKETSLASASVHMADREGNPNPLGVPASATKYYEALIAAGKRCDPEALHSAYMSMLGTWQWFPNKQWVVDAMARTAKLQWGMTEPPPISPSLAHKLRLNNLEGVRYGYPEREAMGRGSTSGPWSSGGPDRNRFPRDGRQGGGFDGLFDNGSRVGRDGEFDALFGGGRGGGFGGGRGGGFGGGRRGGRSGGFDGGRQRGARQGGYGRGREASVGW